MTENMQNSNPLAGYYRQPKLFVNLPSKGRFYPVGALDVSETGEYAVYAMTAKDELMFKTPDALLSGQSTVELIKSCIPAIKDPWAMPNIDLDFALIVIRLATYGERMEINSTCPSCENQNHYVLDINAWVQMFDNFEFQDTISIDPLQIKIRPYTYRETTQASIKTLEQQKIFAVINDESIEDEKKIEMFGNSFVKLTALTVDIIAECITSIETPQGVSTDKNQIKDFINNTSKDVFEKIQGHLGDLKSQIELKSPEVECDNCQHKYEFPITMDQSNFFAVRS
jgi:hypothetical protein